MGIYKTNTKNGTKKMQLDKVGDIVDFEKAEKLIMHEDKQLLSEKISDRENGLDIDDVKSIQQFKLGYTPLNYVILVKRISNDEKVGSIFLPVGSGNEIKAIVMGVGLHVRELVKGDVVIIYDEAITGGVRTSKKIKLNGIEFTEYSVDAVRGVYKERSDIRKQMLADDNEGI